MGGSLSEIMLHTPLPQLMVQCCLSRRPPTFLWPRRTNETHDYRNRDDHVYSAICLPENSDEKFLNREYFWNQAEKSEKRKDAQLAKDFLLALPKELNQTQQICLIKEFARDCFISNNVPVNISIYDKQDGNPFAYILTTTRRLLVDQFDPYKARDLNPSFGKRFIKEKELWGKRWGDFQAEFFKRNNIQAKVDEQQVVPQVHEGHIRNAETHYLKEENKLRKALSEPIIKELKG